MNSDRTLTIGFITCAVIGASIIVWQSKTNSHVEESAESVATQKAKRAPKTKYPILTRISRGLVPPGGIAVRVGGDYSVTTVSSEDRAPALKSEQFESQLKAAIKLAIETERKVEQRYPPPPGPTGSVMPKEGPDRYAPGMFAITLRSNSWSSDVSIPRSEAATDAEIDLYAARITKELYARQLASLTSVAVQNNVAPVGFYVQSKGRTLNSWRDQTLLRIVPMDPQKVDLQIQKILKDAVVREKEYSEIAPSAPLRSSTERVGSNLLEIVIIPGDIKGEIPYGVSERYPTAADVALGADKAIKRLAAQSARQMEEMNTGKPTQ